MLASIVPAAGGDAYYTSFENFNVGEDTIAGTDGWTGTFSGSKLHGIMSEDQHKVVGLGNTAFLGGYVTTAFYTASSGTSATFPYVRRTVNLDPLALGQEVATFGVIFGIKDSTSASLIATNRYKRDNFEFLVYNQVGALLGGVQFDNTTLDTITGLPQCLIYRLTWNGAAYQYIKTDYKFIPETLETLQIRINFRTNRWTASLGGIPLFQDLTFYTGSQAKNFGSVMVKMGVPLYTYNPLTKTTTVNPGDNYLLFDDYAVRTDPVNTTLSVSRSNTGAAVLTWNEEAGYSYQVQYSADCVLWKTDLAGSTFTATITGDRTFTDPTLVLPTQRYYRIKRAYP
jgi:hypothetical protein